jgi:hypothetical protein
MIIILFKFKIYIINTINTIIYLFLNINMEGKSKDDSFKTWMTTLNLFLRNTETLYYLEQNQKVVENPDFKALCIRMWDNGLGQKDVPKTNDYIQRNHYPFGFFNEETQLWEWSFMNLYAEILNPQSYFVRQLSDLKYSINKSFQKYKKCRCCKRHSTNVLSLKNPFFNEYKKFFKSINLDWKKYNNRPGKQHIIDPNYRDCECNCRQNIRGNFNFYLTWCPDNSWVPIQFLLEKEHNINMCRQWARAICSKHFRITDKSYEKSGDLVFFFSIYIGLQKSIGNILLQYYNPKL